MKRRSKAVAGHGAAAVAGTFIGTVVGAGFASGQETLQFFTAFGLRGLAGILLAAALFCFFGVRMLQLGRRYAATSHRPLVLHAVGPRLAPLVDGLLTLFLLATAGAMCAGAAATLAEQYGWARWVGSALTAGVGGATVLLGIDGVVAAIALVAPVLIISILGLAMYSLAAAGGIGAALAWKGMPELAAAGPWWAAAGLYVAYNVLLSAPVLGPLGAAARDRSSARRGGVLGGIGLGLGAAAIHLSVAARMPGAAGYDIPMLYTEGTLAPWVPVAYSLLLLTEVYTTAVAMLFGFAARVDGGEGNRFRLAVIGGAAFAFVGGLFPFSRVVGTLYPLIGAVGVLVLLGLLRPLPATTS